MHNTKTRSRGNQRANRNHGFFAPAFTNIINEILNSPLDEMVNTKPVRFSRPPANVVKTEEGSYLLSLAIPGIAKEDVTINIEKDKMTIKSNAEDDKSDVSYKLREFNFAKFERSFTISDDADTDNISAKFDNGILTITIPTVEAAGPKKVVIG